MAKKILTRQEVKDKIGGEITEPNRLCTIVYAEQMEVETPEPDPEIKMYYCTIRIELDESIKHMSSENIFNMFGFIVGLGKDTSGYEDTIIGDNQTPIESIIENEGPAYESMGGDFDTVLNGYPIEDWWAEFRILVKRTTDNKVDFDYTSGLCTVEAGLQVGTFNTYDYPGFRLYYPAGNKYGNYVEFRADESLVKYVPLEFENGLNIDQTYILKLQYEY